MPSDATDRVLRAMTNDGSFRVLVADTTLTTRAILEAQRVGAHSIEAAAGVITAAVLIRETMAPANRVQVIFSDPLGSQLVGDAFPEGKTRGLARIIDDVLGIQVCENAQLRVERIMRPGKMHQGNVRTERDENLVDTLRKYFLQSEQVTSTVDLACVELDGELVASVGYVVQQLPELTEEALVAMHERWQRFGRLTDDVAAQGRDPDRILAALLSGVEHTRLAESEVVFHCPCDRHRAVSAATALGRADLEDLIVKEEDLSVTCDYCRETYVLGVADYHSVLSTSDDEANDAAL